MIKKRFSLIIILMSISIFFLIVVQATWYSHYSKQLKEIQDSSINLCLNEVANSIKNQEKERFVAYMGWQQSQNHFSFPGTTSFGNLPSVMDAVSFTASVPSTQSSYIISNLTGKTLGQFSGFSKPKNLENLFLSYFVTHPEAFFNPPKTKELELEIQEIFIDKGIETPFEFAILDPSKNRFLVKSEEFDYKSVSREEVYERNILKRNDYLSPKIILYLRGGGASSDRTILVSITSFSLILVIILCFIITVYIVFSQKKIALMKADFINNMTHEFKTPITTISLATQMIKASLDSLKKEKILQFTRIIKDENERLSKFVDRILQMSIYEKGNITLKFIALDINPIIKVEAEKLRKIYSMNNLVLETKLEAQYDSIRGDEIHITNVINNLVENAIKYSREVPHIIISTWNENEKLYISFQDFGIGISKKYHSKVFDELFRVPQGNLHDFKGFGLGLAYVKKIVEKHNGTIGLQSEHGKGCTFTLAFPL